MGILVFDPGDHTGWIHRSDDGTLSGGTILHDVKRIADTIHLCKPDIVVYETFRLYAKSAQSLINNDFYTCQIIGVIKFVCANTPGIRYVVPQAPSVKKFSGGLDARWTQFKSTLPESTTEHLKDAYLHLKYFELHNWGTAIVKYQKEDTW